MSSSNRSCGQLKVGMSSAPSWTARRPEVPAPTWTSRPPPPRNGSSAASAASNSAKRAARTAATAVNWPSIIASAISKGSQTSISEYRGLARSVSIGHAEHFFEEERISIQICSHILGVSRSIGNEPPHGRASPGDRRGGRRRPRPPLYAVGRDAQRRNRRPRQYPFWSRAELCLGAAGHNPVHDQRGLGAARHQEGRRLSGAGGRQRAEPPRGGATAPASLS